MENLITIISLITGIIGSFTGIISLIWHIIKNKPKLKLESAYFQRHGFGVTTARCLEQIGVKIRLRNLSNNPTTIEEILIGTGNIFQEAPFFIETEILGHNSRTFECTLDFTDEEFKKLFDNKGLIRFEVIITHTHGVIKKSGKTNWETGHFSLN
ncbi:MAG: hypothetical protein WC812_01995 [Candidatus Pacearchaeota archaeon]|jgi:hypothetical protein